MNNQQFRKGLDYTGNCVVFFCHDGNDNYLMAKRSVNCRDEQGTWDVGGGGIECFESAVDSVISEIKQEYCIDVNTSDVEFLGYRDVFRTNNVGEKTHWIALDFKVLVDPTLAKIGELHKFEELGWFTLDTLPNPIHSQLAYTIDKYRDKL
jgi:ADP-ribose pyrophosphatase YjhB (NUDIX family)